MIRLQQAQLLRRRMAVMNTRTIAPSAITSSSMQSGGVGSGGSNSNSSSGASGNNISGGAMASGSGGMSPSSVASPVSQISGMNSPHQPGIGLKPGTQTPPANVLQVVKQVGLLCLYFFPTFLCYNIVIFIKGARRSGSPTSSSWWWFWKSYTNWCSNATANYATSNGSYGWYTKSAAATTAA